MTKSSRMNRSRWLLLALAILSVPSIAAIANRLYWLGNDTIHADVVARVNHSVITAAELREQADLIQRLGALRKRAMPSMPTVSLETTSILESIIDARLLSQEARLLKVDVSTKLRDQIREFSTDAGVEGEEGLKRIVTAEGINFDRYKTELETSLVARAVIEEVVGESIVITADDEQAYYKKFASDFDRPEQVHLSEILIASPLRKALSRRDVRDPRVIAAHHKARELSRQIRMGATFEDVARRESSGPTAKEGGDLGWFKRGTLALPLENVAFSLPPGGVSDVRLTKQGYLILKALDHKKAGIPPLAEIKSDVDNSIRNEFLRVGTREHLFLLREQSFIDVKGGFIDKWSWQGGTSDPARALVRAVALLFAAVIIVIVDYWFLTGKRTLGGRPASRQET